MEIPPAVLSATDGATHQVTVGFGEARESLVDGKVGWPIKSPSILGSLSLSASYFGL